MLELLVLTLQFSSTLLLLNQSFSWWAGRISTEVHRKCIFYPWRFGSRWSLAIQSSVVNTGFLIPMSVSYQGSTMCMKLPSQESEGSLSIDRTCLERVNWKISPAMFSVLCVLISLTYECLIQKLNDFLTSCMPSSLTKKSDLPTA